MMYANREELEYFTRKVFEGESVEDTIYVLEKLLEKAKN